MATKKKTAAPGKSGKLTLGGGAGDTKRGSDLDGGGSGKGKSKATGKKK